MKTLFLTSIVFTIFLLPKVFAQELISTKYEKGYMKDGKKISVWDYYDGKQELELKINHTTGKVYYLKPDTTDYVIFDNGQWTPTKLQFYPTPTTGYRNFAHLVLMKLHSMLLRKRDGEMAVMFEVDTAGVTNNFEVIKDLDGDAGKRLVDAIKFAGPWAPARIDKKPYKSRFILSVNYSTGSDSTSVPNSMVPVAKRVAYSIVGIARKFPTDEYSALGMIDPYNMGQRLSFVNRQLTSVPDKIFETKKLVVLDLERNSITELPAAIGNLEKLRGLYLPWNKLKQLPETIANLKHLSTLSIGANEFTEFPEQLCNLVNLEALDLADNKITEIPPCIGNLKNLETISLANNNLTTLPEEFFQLKKLKTIYLNDNHFNQATIDRVNATFKKAKIVWTVQRASEPK